MTENDAIYIIKDHMAFIGFSEYREALKMAIQALEEIQEYRVIGTVEECRKHKKGCCIATVTFDESQMQEIIDKKIKEFELDIQKIRAKAIDEFADKIKTELDIRFAFAGLETKFKVFKAIDEIAVQMKGGAE